MSEMSEESEVKAKRQKVDTSKCIICGKDSSLQELTSPQDEVSWKSLLEAATVRNFEPIVSLGQSSTSDSTPHVLYHRKCRSEFTHKKSLEKITRQKSCSSEENAPQVRQSMRQGPSSNSRVYDKLCIFCLKQSKYIKGTKTREPLTAAVELRADKTIRDIAHQRLDERIISIASRDLIAAEAHYHKTCYKDYTRTRPEKISSECSQEEDAYQKLEKAALNMLNEYIRNEIFSNPQIVSLVELTSKVKHYMGQHGVFEVTDATKNHIRRKLEGEFGDSLHFFSVGRRVYIMPDNLSLESLAIENVILKSKLDIYRKQENIESTINKTALFLHDEIKSGIKEQSWPPHPQELNSAYLAIPDNLLHFLSALLGGKQAPSARVQRLAWSIGQDIIFGVTVGKVLTPKHVLIPWVIKTLTGNVELIKTMNRLGHSCSYSVLEEIDTALCLEKLEQVDEDKFPLPEAIHPSVSTVLAFDNIDRQEEVLSGAGTSHRVNGIIVQKTSMTCAPPKSKSVVSKKDRKRTIHPSDVPLPVYIAGKRKSPPSIKPADMIGIFQETRLRAHQKNVLFILVRAFDQTKQKVASWTGFNILTRNNIFVFADTVGYLPTINAPATEMSTVQEILNQSMMIKSTLHLQHMAVVFDQALYAKATEIVWRNVEKYSSITLMMGNFHTICNMQSAIGKMFGEAGLRDLAVESGVIAEGSVNRILEGKQYNRAIRFHKLVYEALMRLAWSGFSKWLELNHSDDLSNLEETIHVISQLHENVCAVELEAALRDESCQRCLYLFDEYLNNLKDNRGPLASFWMTYISMVEILLGLLRADREGDWHLHISCLREMIPWCFAMDRINYARYLPVYYAQMTQLEVHSPALYRHFCEGGFSVQLRSINPFSRIPVDQTTEETVNKDTQTSGGTRGFSLKPGTVSRFYLTAEHRAAALRQLREQISIQSPGLSHPDLQIPRITRDETDIASLVDLLENNWINPFQEDPSDLVNISTGATAPPEISQDLLSAHQKGEEQYLKFQQRLEKGEGFFDTIKKLNLKTFQDMKKKTHKDPKKELIIKADRRVFGNMILIAQNRKLDMLDVLSHPLGPLPWALANTDGTIKKTSKAVLAKHLEDKVSPAECIPEPHATLIDAMALIQKLHGENHTFEELSKYIFEHMLRAAKGSSRIDIVFDVYKENSIKTAERENRGSQQGITFSQIRPGHKIKNWRRLLSCTESKNKLTKFLAESWKNTEHRKKLGDKVMFVTSGNQCLKLTQGNYELVEELESSQEEADTRLFLHAKHAAELYCTVIIISDDTDVFIISLGLHKLINCRIIVQRGTKAKVRLADVSKLAAALGDDTCYSLIGLHSWTGCDTVSCFSGQGKLKALKVMLKNERYKTVFTLLGKDWKLSNDVLDCIQEFTCKLYCSNTSLVDVNKLRYEMFRIRKGDLESGQLPPCLNTLEQHTLRANYQAAIWRRSLENCPDIPDPTHGHGWVFDEDNTLSIKWMTSQPAPQEVLGLMSCKCSRSCKSPECSCILNRLKCTPACRLQTCSNMEDDEEVLQDPEDSSDSDND